MFQRIALHAPTSPKMFQFEPRHLKDQTTAVAIKELELSAA